MPFSKTFQREFFKSPPQILVPYVKAESAKASNKCDLSSQHVTPTIASFPLSRLLYLQFFTFSSMAQSGRVSRNQSQSIYIQGLSQFGPCLGKTPLG